MASNSHRSNQAGAVTVHNSRFHIGSAEVGAAELWITELVNQPSTWSADALSAGGGRVSWSSGSVELAQLGAERVSWARGSAAVERATATGAELNVSVSSRSGGGSATTATNADRWSWLDGLSGRIDIEVEVAYQAPVIGRRSASHKFAVDIDNGVFDYRQLEAGLAHLENSVLDLEVDGNRLVLEKDLPLVPFDNETLVWWDLDDEAAELARAGHARLSMLPAMQRPVAKEGGGGGRISVDSVVVRLVDVRLTLAGRSSIPLAGGSIELGLDDQAAIEGLSLGGELRSPAEPAAQTVTASADAVRFALGLEAGGRSTRIGSVALTGVTLELRFDGFRLTEMGLTAASLELVAIASEPV